MADTNDKETTLTEEHVIIIACVCGVIIISLLIILFCFIFRRRRNAAKAYQGGNQGDPPPYTAVPANKKPQVYDNQDGPLELYPSRSHQPAAPQAAKDVQFEPWSTKLQNQLGHVLTVSGHTYEDGHHLPYEYNNGVDGYPNRDTTGVASVPHSPSKDKYIGLQDRAGGGDPMMGAGGGGMDPSAGASKPKKVIYEVVV